ncbi:hypothetical protein CYY_006433 [Polysphondylium violaceum]|uniref:Carrier domain-containing protein n=1 Tax=Polysphondylium violaceum TaxID=133409 RepID=A0A8J4V356_9MYCE|nr:hypothetical protein CYY_006433 [Polysphondylium violaceum]
MLKALKDKIISLKKSDKKKTTSDTAYSNNHDQKHAREPVSLFYCNQCSCIIEGTRYVCIECSDMDLCQKCYDWECKYYEISSLLFTDSDQITRPPKDIIRNINTDQQETEIIIKENTSDTSNSNNNQDENNKDKKHKHQKHHKHTKPPPTEITGDGYVIHQDSSPLPHYYTKETKSQLEYVKEVGGDSMLKTIQNIFNAYTDRPCLGIRVKLDDDEVDEGGYEYGFQWKTYGQVYTLVTSLVKALSHNSIERNEFISIYLNNCLEWYVCDYAANLCSLSVVPIHHASNQLALLEQLSNSDSTCVFLSRESLPNLIELFKEFGDRLNSDKKLSIKLIIHKEDDYDKEMVEQYLVPAGIQFKTFNQMLKEGDTHESPKYELVPRQPDDICALNYTSGSTGTPKGVVKIEKIINGELCQSYALYPNSVVSYNTLSHSQRMSDWRYMYMGGRVAIQPSDQMDTLFETIQIIRPISLWGVPRFWNLVYAQYKAQVHDYQLQNPDVPLQKARKAALERMKFVFGDRIRVMVTGGAPTSQEVIDFVKKCWEGISFSNSYGLTEITGVCVDGRITDEVKFKLEPVPEFNYYPTDKPYPRGELYVQSASMSLSYYKNKDLTNDSFIDGWFKTGDIVELVGTRQVNIIDRKKHAFKLSNGEFVAPETLENEFLPSPLIEQIFIYGDRFKAFLVAVVVPSSTCIELFKQENEEEKESKIKTKLLQELNRIAMLKRLPSYEIPKMITVDFTQWTIEAGLITGSGKYNRGGIYNLYKQKIDEMYKQMEQLQSVMESKDSDEKSKLVQEYIRSVLNLDMDDGSIGTLSFTQMGGDSLSAIKLANLLKEKANIDISPTLILNQENNISQLTSLIGNNVNGNGEDLLNANTTMDWEKEMTLPKEIVNCLESIKSLKATNETNQTVFITGSSGFLGSFLLANLLELENVSKVYCLLRNNQKVQDIFKTNLITLSDESLFDKIVVLNGDLSKENFGISQQEYTTLAETVDLVLHNGAIVNMALPYPNMKSVNVNATLDIIKLCSTNKLKKLGFVSTMGIFLSRDQDITETTIPSTDYLDYAGGYNQSKLVADVLVRKAGVHGLPVMIFRPATIFAHSKTGFENKHDFVGFIIKSILMSNSYPHLKTLEQGGQFNLSPVDWVSDSIVSLLAMDNLWKNTNKIFHMVNQHTTPLDLLASLIIQAGHPLDRVSLSEWYQEQLSPDKPLFTVSNLFKKDKFPGFGERGFKCPNTKLYVPLCSPITIANIKSYLNYFNNNK